MNLRRPFGSFRPSSGLLGLPTWPIRLGQVRWSIVNLRRRSGVSVRAWVRCDQTPGNVEEVLVSSFSLPVAILVSIAPHMSIRWCLVGKMHCLQCICSAFCPPGISWCEYQGGYWLILYVQRLPQRWSDSAVTGPVEMGPIPASHCFDWRQ
jgi:hypothetical protein